MIGRGCEMKIYSLILAKRKSLYLEQKNRWLMKKLTLFDFQMDYFILYVDNEDSQILLANCRFWYLYVLVETQGTLIKL